MRFFLEEHKSRRREKGFSIIELLIVLAILGILVFGGLNQLGRYLEKSSNIEIQATLGQSKIEEIKATGFVIGRAAESIIALDSTITGDIDAKTIGPYLNGETAARIDREYTVNINDGVLVEYIGTEVELADPIIYNSQR